MLIIGMLLLAEQAGLKMMHIPYKSSAQSIIDVAAGIIDLQLATIPPALSLHQAGKIDVVAITSAKRMSTASEYSDGRRIWNSRLRMDDLVCDVRAGGHTPRRPGRTQRCYAKGTTGRRSTRGPGQTGHRARGEFSRRAGRLFEEQHRRFPSGNRKSKSEAEQRVRDEVAGPTQGRELWRSTRA